MSRERLAKKLNNEKIVTGKTIRKHLFSTRNRATCHQMVNKDALFCVSHQSFDSLSEGLYLFMKWLSYVRMRLCP